MITTYIIASLLAISASSSKIIPNNWANCYAPPLVYGQECNSTRATSGNANTSITYSVIPAGDFAVNCKGLGMGYPGSTSGLSYYDIYEGATLCWGSNWDYPSIICKGQTTGTALTWQWITGSNNGCNLPWSPSPGPTPGSDSAAILDFSTPQCNSQQTSGTVKNATCYQLHDQNGTPCASEIYLFTPEGCQSGLSYLYQTYSDTACIDIIQVSYLQFGVCGARPNIPLTCGANSKWEYPYIILSCDSEYSHNGNK